MFMRFFRDEDTGFEMLLAIIVIVLFALLILYLLMGRSGVDCGEGFACDESDCGCCIETPLGDVVPYCGVDVCGEGRTLVNGKCCLINKIDSCILPNEACVFPDECSTDEDCTANARIGCSAKCEVDESGRKVCKPCEKTPCDPLKPNACCSGYFCDSDSGLCESCSDVICYDDSDCCEGYSCMYLPGATSGRCTGSKGAVCAANKDCGEGYICDPNTHQCVEGAVCEGMPCENPGEACKKCDSSGNCIDCVDKTVCASVSGGNVCKLQGNCPPGYFEDISCTSGCRDAKTGECMEVLCEGKTCNNPGEKCIECIGDNCYTCTDNSICGDDKVCHSITSTCPAGTVKCGDMIAGCSCCEEITVSYPSACIKEERTNYYVPKEVLPSGVRQVLPSVCPSGYQSSDGKCCDVRAVIRDYASMYTFINCGTQPTFFSYQPPTEYKVPIIDSDPNCGQGSDYTSYTYYVCLDNKCTLDPNAYDLNGDGILDNNDVQIFEEYVSEGGVYNVKYDFNRDGKIDESDRSCLSNICTSGCRIIK